VKYGTKSEEKEVEVIENSKNLSKNKKESEKELSAIIKEKKSVGYVESIDTYLKIVYN